MHCKYLSCYTPATNTWSVASCSFHGAPYIPSVRELENYCKQGRHQDCPVFFQSLPLRFDEYLWPELEYAVFAPCR